MWLEAGLLREAEGLHRAEAELQTHGAKHAKGNDSRGQSRRGICLRWPAMIVQCALGREESRGAHFRKDFPTRNEVAEHSILERGRLRFET